MPVKMQDIVLTDAERLEHIRKYPLPNWCKPKWIEKYNHSLIKYQPKEKISAKRKNTKKHNSFSYKILHSPEWKELREKAIEFYGNICMCCQSTDKIQVDHIKPKSKYPELALDFNNLQILCWDCNKRKCHRDETDYRKHATYG